MEIEFTDDELKTLFTEEKVTHKKFKSNKPLVKQYVKTVKKLIAATRIEDLLQSSSLNYEKLGGNRAGTSSVKINQQYRLLFAEVTNDKDPPEVILLSIEEISKHYE